MSASAVSPAALAPASPSGPTRGSRPPHPRPTTYSGPSPSAAQQSGGPPIPPPPRTSSKSGAPTSSHGESRGNSSRGGDGQNDRDRDKERERAERRRAEENQNRPAQPVARSNSTRASSSRGASASQVPQTSTSDGRTSSRRRQDSESGASRGRGNGEEQRKPSARKETRFGEYILGQTLGEGEFGKVKLGWRRDGGVQVAIKLIRRDSVSPHPNRLSKIYREIAILRTLSHPNIVRLHEMVETDRHIGIILEYASGGELFDYILTHRYLKDPPACRLFAQLVSGVGYLHKKGIVHRDLKLENLLLDRNRNIIITDFGFANVFDPLDELGELEDRLDDPAIIRELEKGVPHTDRKPDGSSLLSIIGPGQTRRRGDLMATSCGSPCYAAPELVVSDGLYTGRKVDVWSCGVILYAMLAGYLPFDDDPANPEGDNINLLYKYIVSTPLTFPEYVTPHARDLLRRILVPDPRKRADLFEVAHHSWLSPFADIVNKVTSATTSIKDVETAVVTTPPKTEAPGLNRSHSVREPSTTSHHHTIGALGPRHHAHEQIVPPTQPKPSSDNKRRTVQVEYVEPASSTKRGSTADPDSPERQSRNEAAPAPVVATHKDGSVTRAATSAGTTRSTYSKYADKQKAREAPKDDKLPVPEKGKTRPISYQYPQSSSAQRSGGAIDGSTSGPPSRRPSRDTKGGPPVSSKSGDNSTRPNTANSLGSQRLPSRGSYSRPAAPSVAQNNAQGRIAMPKGTKQYTISAPIPQTDSNEPDFSTTRPIPQPDTQPAKGHKRANTVGGGVGGESGRFLGKIMGSSERPDSGKGQAAPSSGGPRQSFDQGRNKTEKGSGGAGKSRRFSLLPTSFSLRSMSNDSKHERKLSRTGSRQYGQGQPQPPQVQSQPQLGIPNNDGASARTGSDTSLAAGSAPASAFRGSIEQTTSPNSAPSKRATLSKHKKLGDAYEGEMSSGGHGSSGPARRVMDFFRRRGTARSKGEKS